MKHSFATLLTAIMFSTNAAAQHADIWLTLNANKVEVSPQNIETGEDVLVDQTTGYFLFKGDFGDLGQGPYGTDDPGWQAESGTFQAGAILSYQASGQLLFWDGIQWTNNVPDSERLHLIDALGVDTFWDNSGTTNTQGSVDQVLGDGSIHSHLDFNIENSGGTGNPATGAYMIELAMVARDNIGGPIIHNLSEPFRTFQNLLELYSTIS